MHAQYITYCPPHTPTHTHPHTRPTTRPLQVRNHARALVFTALALLCLVPFGAASFAMYRGSTPAAITLLVLAAAFYVLIFLWREQLGLVTDLLGVAGQGLAANLALAGVALLIELMLAVTVLFLAGLAAVTNGAVVYNPARAAGDVDRCVDEGGGKVVCCKWRVRGRGRGEGRVLQVAGACLLTGGLDLRVGPLDGALFFAVYHDIANRKSVFLFFAMPIMWWGPCPPYYDEGESASWPAFTPPEPPLVPHSP